jgi:hypothetical protein
VSYGDIEAAESLTILGYGEPLAVVAPGVRGGLTERNPRTRLGLRVVKQKDTEAETKRYD